MEKLIIEVGSTVTKIDKYTNNTLKRIKDKTIPFKKHYKEEGKLNENDVLELINLVNSQKAISEDIYVCGTSIFRDLTSDERESFLKNFKADTGYDFKIITAEEESRLTVLGAARLTNSKVCVFIGGGGSTEISIYENGKIIETANTNFGVIDAMQNYENLNHDIASTPLEEVMDFVKNKLNLPETKCDLLILAGGAHEMFTRVAKLKYEENTIYKDLNAPIMMDIETRRNEVKRYYESISLDEIKSKVDDPSWWYGTRMMCAFSLVVAESIKAEYIIPTNIGMSYGIIEELKNKN